MSLNASVIILEERLDQTKIAMDTMFLTVCGIFIYLMQAGFAFLEAGAVRSKNTVNILIKNALDSFFGGVVYWLVGYAFAFGEGNSFIGFSYFALSNLPVNLYVHWFFQFVFAATAATIVSGAVAERCEFTAYIIYSTIVTGFIYPVVSHWTWSSAGWLTRGHEYNIDGEIIQATYHDFAGSGVVHMLGGIVAFIGALVLGPRIGRFDPETGNPKEIRGHNTPYAALGGFILVFGFFAFNGSSQGTISNPGDGGHVSLAICNTVLGASGGAFTTLLLNKTHTFGDRKWSFLMTLNGSLTGMVAVCAGCNQYRPYMGFIIGIMGGLSYMTLNWLVLKIKVDDPLDATAVHFGGGIVGVLTVPLFSYEFGLFYFWDTRACLNIAWQLLGLLCIFCWAAFLSGITFMALKKAKMLRVSEEYELKGLDLPKHGEAAYPAEAYGHGWEIFEDVLENVAKNSIAPATSMVVSNGTDIKLPVNATCSESPEVDAHIRNQKRLQNVNKIFTVEERTIVEHIALE